MKVNERVPEGWKKVRLGEIGEIVYGERLLEEEYEQYGVSKVFGTSGVVALSDKYLDIGESVVIPRKGSINTKFYVAAGEKFWVIDTAFYFKTKLNAKFLFYKLEIIDFYLLNKATGVPSLNRKTISQIKVTIPKSKEEQERITSILSQIDKVIESEQRYKEKLERIKQGLMEDLLTGKVRVTSLIT